MEFCNRFAEFVVAIKPAKSSRYFEHLFWPSSEPGRKEELSAHLLAAREYGLELSSRNTADPAIVINTEIVLC